MRRGDAIFRRSADSRLTYGNDAFFKLFGLNPKTRHRPVPSRPIPIPTAARPCSAASRAWRPGARG